MSTDNPPSLPEETHEPGKAAEASTTVVFHVAVNPQAVRFSEGEFVSIHGDIPCSRACTNDPRDRPTQVAHLVQALCKGDDGIPMNLCKSNSHFWELEVVLPFSGSTPSEAPPFVEYSYTINTKEGFLRAEGGRRGLRRIAEHVFDEFSDYKLPPLSRVKPSPKDRVRQTIRRMDDDVVLQYNEIGMVVSVSPDPEDKTPLLVKNAADVEGKLATNEVVVVFDCWDSRPTASPTVSFGVARVPPTPATELMVQAEKAATLAVWLSEAEAACVEQAALCHNARHDIHFQYDCEVEEAKIAHDESLAEATARIKAKLDRKLEEASARRDKKLDSCGQAELDSLGTEIERVRLQHHEAARLRDLLHEPDFCGPVMRGAKRRRPEEHYCGITREVLVDPVITECVCGQSFEREAILEWFHEHDTCANCASSLSNLRVIPNKGLRNLIESW